MSEYGTAKASDGQSARIDAWGALMAAITEKASSADPKELLALSQAYDLLK